MVRQFPEMAGTFINTLKTDELEVTFVFRKSLASKDLGLFEFFHTGDTRYVHSKLEKFSILQTLPGTSFF